MYSRCMHDSEQALWWNNDITLNQPEALADQKTFHVGAYMHVIRNYLDKIMIIANQKEAPAAPDVMESPLHFQNVGIKIPGFISPLLKYHLFS